MYDLQALALDSSSQTLRPSGLLRGVESYQEQLNWQDTSEIKIVCEASPYNFALVAPGNALLTPERVAWYIRSVEVNDERMTVRAVDILDLYNDRAVRGTHLVRSLPGGFSALLGGNAIPFCQFVQLNAVTWQPIDFEVSWGQLGDAYLKMAKRGNFGFVPVPQAEGYLRQAMIQSRVTYGVNRTQRAHATGFFSDAVDNIDTLKIVDNIQKYKNCAVVLGKEEKEREQKWVVVQRPSYDGHKRELFVDAKDLGREYTTVLPDGTSQKNTYSEAQYLEVLRGRGYEKLDESRRESEVSVKATESSFMKYGVHYGLGDIVPVYLKKYDMQVAARVTSVYTAVEKGSRLVTPALADFEIWEG